MKVGIIGAGTMGSGIAQAFAQTEGYEVYLCDINEEFAANGKKKIAKGLEKSSNLSSQLIFLSGSGSFKIASGCSATNF